MLRRIFREISNTVTDALLVRSKKDGQKEEHMSADIGSLDMEETDLGAFQFHFLLSDESSIKMVLPERVVTNMTKNPQLNLLCQMALMCEKSAIKLSLDVDFEQFCLIGPYLKTRRAPSRTHVANWPRFVRSCDYLGVPELPELITNDSEHIYLSKLTYISCVDRAVETRVRILHAARAAGALPPALDMQLYAKIGERYQPSREYPEGICSTLEKVRIGSLIQPLPSNYNQPLSEKEFVTQYPYPIHDSEVAGIEFPKTTEEVIQSLKEDLADFPWYGEASLVLAGGAVLKHMTGSSRKFIASDYDFFLITDNEADATKAIRRVHSWVANRYGQYYMMMRSEHAVTFMTPDRVYQVILRLYGVALVEPEATQAQVVATMLQESCGDLLVTRVLDDPMEDSLIVAQATRQHLEGIEQILCGFDIDPCAVAFDGSRLWTIPRALRALQSRVIMVDPERQSTTALKRYLKYLNRNFLLALVGLSPEMYKKMRVRTNRPVSNHIINSSTYSFLERLVCRGRLDRSPDDYSPECFSIDLVPRHWATKDQRFHHYIERVAKEVISKPSGSCNVFTRNIDAIIDTPASGTMANMRVLANAANPMSVYMPVDSAAHSIRFRRQLGNGQDLQISGSFNPTNQLWYPNENVV